MSRLAFSCAALLSATALAAACSVYDESLLGAGGVDETSSSKSGKGNGGGDGDGGAGPTTTTDGPTTGTESTSSTGDASTGQSGSVTTGAECTTPDDCPGEDSECAERSCDGNACSVINKESGFVVSSQTAGDCIVQLCDGQGNLISDVDDADVPAQVDDCILRTCDAGVPGEGNAPEGDPCGVDELCDGAGDCVECLDASDCVGQENCNDAHLCVAPQCDDGAQNGNETDTDCGGGTCPDCANGDTCLVNGDCVSNSCAGTCQPSCTDGLQNNGETDADCGGPNCGTCGVGLACDDLDDCGSGFCLNDVCRPLLYFSEYVEGSSYNKAIEIFNFGNEPLDLAGEGCSVRISRNGGSTMADIGLTGTIDILGSPATGTHVLCFAPGGQNMLSPELLAKCDEQSSALNHNGNDALVLSCGGVVLDNFGQVGTDPGAAGWGSGTTSTVDHTLRRKGSIIEGDRNGANAFDPATEWDGYASDTFTGLGDHP